MKIEFLKTCTVKDGTGTTYHEGEVYELSSESAMHWVKRGHAQRVADSEKAVEPTTNKDAKDFDPKKGALVEVDDSLRIQKRGHRDHRKPLGATSHAKDE